MKNRNAINKIRVHYFKVPNEIFDVGLSPGAVALYCFLVSCLETFNPSIRWVAEKLNISNNTVMKYYTELESRNMIICNKQGFYGCVSKWSFTDISQWEKDSKVVARLPTGIFEVK